MESHNKKLINDPNDVVTEFIQDLVETYPGLQYLDGFPQVKVVLRTNVSGGTYDKVAVISGGGTGHEPAHAEFVGEGMLTAAICGDGFASPSVNSILAGIRAVTGPMGCLLIVMNYTGDRLNFGLAAEQAKSEGYKVETVIVGDDCALPPPPGIAGRRGLAGTILVHKIAGAAAASGFSLAYVTAEARRASEMVGTMGVALSVCTLPGQVTPDRLGLGKMELGLGIHGEPGAAVADFQPVDVIVSHVLKQILSPETNYVPITRGSRVVLMVNGLGATPAMELMIASSKAVPNLQLEHGLAVDRVYTGSFMTSLDMAGFSISIMKADQTILKFLDASTKAPYWPVGVDGNHIPANISLPLPPPRSTKTDEDHKVCVKIKRRRRSSHTTVMASIGHNVIYMAGDGKVVDTNKDIDMDRIPFDYITSGISEKIHRINRNTFALLCGDGSVSDMIVGEIAASVLDGSDVCVAKDVANAYIQRIMSGEVSINPNPEEEDICLKELDVAVILCGWNGPNATLYEVGIEDGQPLQNTVRDRYGESIIEGTGSQLASKFISRVTIRPVSDEDNIELFIKAMVVAALGENTTGGYVSTLCLRRNVINQPQVRGHVVDLLRRYVVDLADYLEDGVFMISEIDRNGYDGVFELLMRQSVTEIGKILYNFDELHDFMVTLGVYKEKLKCTVIHFINKITFEDEEGEEEGDEEMDEYVGVSDLVGFGVNTHVEYGWMTCVGQFRADLPELNFGPIVTNLTQKEIREGMTLEEKNHF